MRVACTRCMGDVEVSCTVRVCGKVWGVVRV